MGTVPFCESCASTASDQPSLVPLRHLLSLAQRIWGVELFDTRSGRTFSATVSHTLLLALRLTLSLFVLQEVVQLVRSHGRWGRGPLYTSMGT